MAFPKNELFPTFDQQVSVASRALGHPARIFILRLLHDQGPRKFNEVVKALPLNEGTVTAHLKKLRKERLVDVEVMGLVNIYRLNQAGVDALFALQKKLYALLSGMLMDQTGVERLPEHPTGLSSLILRPRRERSI